MSGLPNEMYIMYTYKYYKLSKHCTQMNHHSNHQYIHFSWKKTSRTIHLAAASPPPVAWGSGGAALTAVSW